MLLNQLRAGNKTKQVIDSLYQENKLGKSLKWLGNKTDEEIGRRICLPTAASTAINLLYNREIIGDNSGLIVVADFYKWLLPLHKTGPTSWLPPYDNGWWVIDNEGNVFHQAIIAFAQLFDIYGLSIINFPSIEWIYDLPQKGEFIVVASVKNHSSRHSVTILGLTKKECQYLDPFQILKNDQTPKVTTVFVADFNQKLARDGSRPTQAIVLSLKPLVFPKNYIKPVFIPDYVTRQLTRVKKDLIFKNLP